MERISCIDRLAAILAVLLIAVQAPAAASAVPANAATAATQAANAGVLSSLPFSDKQFIGLDQPAPATVNPSLWRNAQLKLQYGLFKVTERIYQVRGYDLSNITFIQGDTGWIVMDPLISTETAKAALDLVTAQLGEGPAAGPVRPGFNIFRSHQAWHRPGTTQPRSETWQKVQRASSRTI
jgi:alkyl sulfatase BDS1-like metallo-beta-lactamase superfamily hydrolase